MRMRSPGTISAAGTLLPLAVAHHRCLGRRHLAQRRHRRFRARLLDVAHDGVEQHDGENRHRFVGQRRFAFDQPQRRGNRGGDEQQNHEHVAKLREKFPPPRHRLFRRQLVAAIAFEPRARFGIAQAAMRVRSQRGDNRVHRLLIRRRRSGLNRSDGQSGRFHISPTGTVAGAEEPRWPSTSSADRSLGHLSGAVRSHESPWEESRHARRSAPPARR